MATIDLLKTEIELSNGVKFSIFHNIPIRPGLQINTLQAAIDNWLARTGIYTAESFCKYVMSKYNQGLSDYVAFTEKQVKVLLP